jgi:hypothetical protein
VRPGVLRPLIPPGLDLDTYDEDAWIGIVPFGMSRVRARMLPPIPWTSKFPELNVRTYVTARGQAGVWFFSLDAASPLAVRVARRTFHLPYFDARMSMLKENGRIRYESTRTHRGAPPAAFCATYGPTDPVTFAAKGSLEDFLTNRLCLYSLNSAGKLLRGDIDHPPWPLQSAETEIERNQMAEAIGVQLPDTKPLLHYSAKLDVVAWRIQSVDG